MTWLRKSDQTRNEPKAAGGLESGARRRAETAAPVHEPLAGRKAEQEAAGSNLPIHFRGKAQPASGGATWMQGLNINPLIIDAFDLFSPGDLYPNLWY